MRNIPMLPLSVIGLLVGAQYYQIPAEVGLLSTDIAYQTLPLVLPCAYVFRLYVFLSALVGLVVKARA